MINDLLNSMMFFWKDEHKRFYARKMPEIALIRGHSVRWVEVLQKKDMLADNAESCAALLLKRGRHVGVCASAGNFTRLWMRSSIH